MKTIHKFQLSRQARTEFVLPVGYKVLTVQEQGGLVTLWVLLDDEELNVRRVAFLTYFTGAPLTAYPDKYIGTVQLLGGHVIHVFEEV